MENTVDKNNFDILREVFKTDDPKEWENQVSLIDLATLLNLMTLARKSENKSELSNHLTAFSKEVYTKEQVLEELNLLYSMKNSMVDTFTDKNDRITMKWFNQNQSTKP